MTGGKRIGEIAQELLLASGGSAKQEATADSLRSSAMPNSLESCQAIIGDLRQERMRQLLSDSAQLQSITEKNFDKLDKYHKGNLTAEELRQDLLDPTLPQDARLLAGSLLGAYKDIAGLSPNGAYYNEIGIRKKNIAEFSYFMGGKSYSEMVDRIASNQRKSISSSYGDFMAGTQLGAWVGLLAGREGMVALGLWGGVGVGIATGAAVEVGGLAIYYPIVRAWRKHEARPVVDSVKARFHNDLLHFSLDKACEE